MFPDGTLERNETIDDTPIVLTCHPTSPLGLNNNGCSIAHSDSKEMNFFSCEIAPNDSLTQGHI